MHSLVKSHEILRKMSLVMMLMDVVIKVIRYSDRSRIFEIKGTNLKDWDAKLLFWPIFPKTA